ncbi:MAG: ribonuclease P protein component [Firmicutes bacterium]|nr:ribonuclease P protein component [Bacillota bacterium]
MKKYERVKSNILFNEVINKGKKRGNQFFTIFFMESSENNKKFGVAVSKRLGNAVIRNRLKRQTRELLDKTKILFKNNGNYIIIVKEKCLKERFSVKLAALEQLIGDMNEKK